MKVPIRPLFALLIALPLIVRSASPVHAEIVCMETTPVAGFDITRPYLKFQGNNLLFLTDAATLSRYDVSTGIITPVTTTFSSSSGSFDLDGDHIIFVDEAEQIQLYTISTGNTLQITPGSKQYLNPRIEGNYVVYQKKKQTAAGKTYYRIYVYDIVTATAKAVGPKTLQHDGYLLNQGRILWQENNLYSIATGTSINLGPYHFVALDANYAVAVVRANYASNVFLKDLSTGIISQITHYRSGEVGEVVYINNAVLEGDYLAWAVDISDTEGSYGGVVLYQISTQTYIDLGMPESSYPLAKISESFVAGLLLDDVFDFFRLYLYDIASTSMTPMAYQDYIATLNFASDQGNVAWMAAKVDNASGETYDSQVLLHKNCGSTPKIIAQSHDLNILTGRNTELFVTSGANQPITYQWYQGVTGDTSLPVGDNSATFTTPPITQSTTYWAHLSNPYGIEDSTSITVIPGETAEILYDGSFEQSIYESNSVWKSKQIPHTVYTTYTDVHSGTQALLVSAYDAYPKAKVKQHLAHVPFQIGDQLTLSGWMKGTGITAASAVIQLRVDYSDGSSLKAVLKPVLDTFDYTLFTAEPVTISGEVSAVQVQIKYKYGGKIGGWILDDLSVLQSSSPIAHPVDLPVPSRPQSRK